MILYLYSMLVQGDRSVGSFPRFQLKNTLIRAIIFWPNYLHYSTVLTYILFLSLPLPHFFKFICTDSPLHYFSLPILTSNIIFSIYPAFLQPTCWLVGGGKRAQILNFSSPLLHYPTCSTSCLPSLPPWPTTSITLRGEIHHPSYLPPLWIDLSICTSAPLRLLYLSTCLTLLVALLSL